MNFVASLESTAFHSGQWYGAHSKVKERKRDQNDGAGSYSQQQNQNDNQPKAGHAYNIICKWEPFKEQILQQWDRLSSNELDQIGPNRSKLAILIENRYGIASHLVENYLRNFERTLPLI